MFLLSRLSPKYSRMHNHFPTKGLQSPQVQIPHAISASSLQFPMTTPSPGQVHTLDLQAGSTASSKATLHLLQSPGQALSTPSGPDPAPPPQSCRLFPSQHGISLPSKGCPNLQAISGLFSLPPSLSFSPLPLENKQGLLVDKRIVLRSSRRLKL